MKNLFALFIALFSLAACQSGNENNSAQETGTGSPAHSATVENENFKFEGCFQLEESEGENKSVTFIILKIEGTAVTGEEAVEMTGPEYNAVAAGSFAGKMQNGTITVVYEYEIEGSEQKEEQEFKLAEHGLLMTSSPLDEMNGMLVLKQKGLFNRLIPKIDCP